MFVCNTTMERIPTELTVLICSFLSANELHYFSVCSKWTNQLIYNNIAQFKDILFINRWNFTQKCDSLPLTLAEKIKRKIRLEKNWENPGK